MSDEPKTTPDVFTVYQADTWFALPDAERCAVKDWLVDHGIDPREVTMSEPVTVRGDQIHYWGMTIESVHGTFMQVKAALNDQGERCIVAEERTVPLKSAPPRMSTAHES